LLIEADPFRRSVGPVAAPSQVLRETVLRRSRELTRACFRELTQTA
jgi:hypothetical protein